jgi:hypothetical protein
LIFSSALSNGRTARGLINERANQSTRNDPLRTRDVKHGLSRSFPPLLWISSSAQNFLQIFFARPIPRVVKRQTDELRLAGEKFWSGAASLPLSSVEPDRCCAVARTVQPRNFAEKIPSRASIS